MTTQLGRGRLSSSSLEISELCLGTVTFGDLADETTCFAILDRFVEAGGNIIDTADVYAEGHAEEIVGRWMQGRRDDVVIATKGGMGESASASREYLSGALDGSLRRLRTDHVDLYMVHLPDPTTPLDETIAALDMFVQSGKVLHVGVSNYAAWQLTKAIGIANGSNAVPLIALEVQYSLLSRDVELDLVPACVDGGVEILAWGALGGGLLSGKYELGAEPSAGTRLADAPATAHRLNEKTDAVIRGVRQVAADLGRSPAQVALRWVADRRPVATAVVGVRSVHQLDDNLGIAGWTVEPEQLAFLDRLSRPALSYPHDLQRLFGRRPPIQ